MQGQQRIRIVVRHLHYRQTSIDVISPASTTPVRRYIALEIWPGDAARKLAEVEEKVRRANAIFWPTQQERSE
jgi:hypothetical protein